MTCLLAKIAMPDHSHVNEQAPMLVGRAREQDALRECLATMLAGRGRLVLIGGQAGIGKTALVQSLGHAVQQHGARVLTGQCYDLTETPPYGPWVELLADAYTL